MCDMLRHRGPDDWGNFSDSMIALGMTRLSIIDLAGGHQPMSNEDESVWVVFNGEIYNYQALKSLLEERGHVFRTSSDTETILHAYEEWGQGCIEQLHGMFAFAVWDSHRQRLLLARDRLGKKPLYYFADQQRFVFASELKALLASGCVPRRLNRAALQLFFTLGYVPAPYTMLEQVHKLPAGHYLVVDQSGRAEQNSYWDISPKSDPDGSFEASKGMLHQLLSDSVRLRLIADVPVGVLLSGGIDSSTITALAAQQSPELKTFSVGFAESALNELSDARRVAKHLATDHHEILVDQCPPDLFRQLTWHMDEPSADPAIVPTYKVCQLAREMVKVVLTGEGGDEVFGGYQHYRQEGDAQRIHRLPAWLRHHLLVPSARFANRVRGKSRYHPRTLWNWELPVSSDLLAWIAVFTQAEKEQLIGRTGYRDSEDDLVASHMDYLARSGRSMGLERYLYLDIKLGLADGLLMKVDRMSMATSLEARTPFLDHRVVELAFALSADYKLRNGTGKFILRELASDLLPPETAGKPKQIFGVPERRWLTHDLATLFWDLHRSQPIQSLDLFAPGKIQAIWEHMQTDTPGASKQIWAILSFMTWYDHYMVNAGVAEPASEHA